MLIKKTITAAIFVCFGILVGEASAMAPRTIIEEVLDDGTVLKSKYRKGDYQAKVEADAVKANTTALIAHEQEMERLKAEKDPHSVKCTPPNLAGVEAGAAMVLAMGYNTCIVQSGSGSIDMEGLAELMSAGTGNSTSPVVQLSRSHNSKVVQLGAQDLQRSADTKALVGKIAGGLLNLAAIRGGGRGGGGGNSIGDGNIFNIKASNSGDQGGGGAGLASLGEGGSVLTGLPGSNDQTRQMNISIFGDGNNGQARDSGRLGFAPNGSFVWGEPSATGNLNRGQQRQTIVGDEVGDVSNSDPDSLL